MPAELAFQFDQADVHSFYEQMRRRTTALQVTPQNAVRIGTIALLKSMRSSTKMSPKRRKVRVPEDKKAREARYKGMRLFIAEGMDRDTGGPHKIQIWAPDFALAKLHPKAQIVKRGLAKQSWGWAMHALFQERSGSIEMYGQESAVQVSKRFDESTGYAEAIIENKLEYIRKALQGGKGPAVSTAMARASASMKKVIDMAIEKATREAGY